MSSNEVEAAYPLLELKQIDGVDYLTLASAKAWNKAAITSTKQEAIEEGKEIAYGNVAKWFVIPIKLQDDTNCGVCGGALAEVRSKYPHGEKRKVCPTCAIEILEDIYSSCANRTASQLNELQDRKDAL